MTRLDAPPGRQRERIVGAVIVLVGVAVLVLSLVALLKAGHGPASDVSGAKVTLPPASSSGSAPASGGASASTTASPSTGTSGSGASSTASSSTSGSASSTTAKLPLVVLNNTKTTNLASQAAQTFEQGGWTVSSTGNLSQDILSTCAYYDPDVTGAQAAAEALMAQFPAIKRTKEKFGALPAGPIVVVLTSDYTAQ
jgi:hypothetical protein